MPGAGHPESANFAGFFMIVVAKTPKKILFHSSKTKSPTAMEEKSSENNEVLILAEAPLTKEEITDFKKLDAIVQKSAGAFVECGNALAEIQRRNLWRISGKKTWEEYCRGVLGFSMPYANRIMHAAKIVGDLKTLPIGKVLPTTESQIRPLIKLKSPEQQAEAWKMANETAKKKGDSKPTSNMVSQAVAQLLGTGAPQESKPTRTAQRVALVSKLNEIITSQTSWEDAKELLQELTKLIIPKEKNKEKKEN